MKPSNRSAAARTIPMPGVDLGEQEDRAALQVTGPMVERFVLENCELTGNVLGIHSTHLRIAGAQRPLCEAIGRAVDLSLGNGTCMACRVEASRIGAVLR